MGRRLMPHLELLKELIHPNAVVNLKHNENGKSSVDLEEPREYKIRINNLPSNSMVFKTDRFPSPDTIFNCSKGECKRADFVIVTDEGNQKYIFFIELKSKSKTSTTKEVTQQFLGSQSVLKYTKEIGKLFWKETAFLEGFECRFIVLVDLKIDKKRTRNKKENSRHNNANNFLQLSGKHSIQFNELK